MSELKAKPFDGGGGAVSVRKSKRSRAASRDVGPSWGPVALDADEFAEFEKCILTLQLPTKAVVKAAEFLRTLPAQKR